MHTYAHRHIHTYAHTDTHTHTRMPWPSWLSSISPTPTRIYSKVFWYLMAFSPSLLFPLLVIVLTKYAMGTEVLCKYQVQN